MTIPATARALALIVEALRASPTVRQKPRAAAWLRHGNRAEGRLLQHLRSRERWLLPAARHAPRAFLRLVDQRIPGTSRHILARKLWFHDHARQWLLRHQQIVNLGAGLDALGLRLTSEFPDARILEVDTDEVIAAKQAWLKARPHPSARLMLQAHDLAEGIPEFPGIELHQPTLILAEGLLMYLPERAAHGLLHEAAKAFRGHLGLAFSILQAPGAGRRRSIDRLDDALRRRGRENFEWRPSPTHLETVLQKAGFLPDGTGIEFQDYGEHWMATARAPREAQRTTSPEHLPHSPSV